MSILLSGSECWTTYRHQERRLNAFHLRCLRSILGVTWRDHIPNTEVLGRLQCLDIRTILQKRRIRWTGHVLRMSDSRLPKSILYGELADSPRPRGRPKLRFKDVLKRDLQRFNIDTGNWEKAAKSRLEWRQAIHQGSLQAHRKYLQECDARRAARGRRADRQQ